jgi:SAM-dependent methyltransferase
MAAVSESGSASGSESERSCILCESPTRRALEKNGFWIVECVRCGHRSTELEPSDDHVAKVYGDEYFEGGGAGYTNYFQEGDLLRARGRKYGDLLNSFTSPGSVLDVGAAAGFILAGLRDTGWMGVGVEPNQKMVDFAVNSLGLDVRQGSLEQFETDRTFDAVTMIQVLPHFFNPHRALARASALTKPNGLWLIETWDRNSLTAKVFGKYWHEYSPPSVLQWFSRDGVRTLAGKHGFDFVAEGRPSKWLSGAHARSLLEESVKESALLPLVQKVTRVIPKKAKLPYPAEDLCWMIFRKR